MIPWLSLKIHASPARRVLWSQEASVKQIVEPLGRRRWLFLLWWPTGLAEVICGLITLAWAMFHSLAKTNPFVAISAGGVLRFSKMSWLRANKASSISMGVWDLWFLSVGGRRCFWSGLGPALQIPIQLCELMLIWNPFPNLQSKRAWEENVGNRLLTIAVRAGDVCCDSSSL